jgi:formate dehydrogenase (hydrogenase)
MKYARLTEPLVRDNGSLRPASWDEALDRAASGFRRQVEVHGPQTFGMLSCSKATNEVNFLAQKFTRVAIGCNNMASATACAPATRTRRTASTRRPRYS